MEPPRAKIISRQEKIKDILGNLGIAGETVAPSAARTIEELTHLGIVKEYSTIVAVGSEAIANKVITALMGQKNLQNIVLGVIPDNFDSQIAKMIGANDLYTACEALKTRRLKTFDLCHLEPNKYFLTQGSIETFRNQEIYFSIDDAKGKTLTNQIIIKPGLKMNIYDKTYTGKTPRRFFNWLFGKKEKDIYTSYFHSKRIRLEAENANHAFKVANETIAKTPVTIHNRNKALKIIVARDKIKSKD